MLKDGALNLIRKSLFMILSLLFIFFLQNCEDEATGNDEIEPPTNLTIVDNNPSNFQISWKDNSDDETGFSIERKKDSGSFTEIATVNANVNAYTDIILESGVYSYRVRAIKGTEYSDYSNTVSETINAAIEHTTNITTSETWASGIHIIQGTVYVSNGAILTIQAGSIIKFNKDASIIVQTNSGLIADGTTGAITFTGFATENGYWRFIQFNDDALNASCKLINCVIEYGGGYSNSSASLIINNDATVNNCLIRYSSSNGAIIDDAARPSFTNNTITLNDASPIYAYFTSAASIGAGSYSGNSSDFIDLYSGTRRENGTLLKQDVPYRLNATNYIENSTLTISAGANFLMNADATLIISTNGGLTATGTELDSIHFTGFAEQKGYWRYVSFEDDALDANCNLDYCIFEYGGGYSSSSGIVIINNDVTITNSAVRNSSSHGVLIDDGARPTFNNNTITMNDLSPIYGDFESITSIGYGDYNGNTNDYIDLDAGTLSEVGTLKKQNVPYRLNATNYIEEVTLTIEAGTMVYFNHDATLIVSTNGGLIAQGTLDDSVYFGSNVAQNGYWRYIQYTDVAKDADCIMDYCHIENGGGYSSSSACLIVDNDASITNTTIRNSSSYGLLIYDRQAGPVISSCTITHNDKSPILAYFENIGSIGYGDYSGNTGDFLEIASGTLSNSLTLKKQNVPYRFNATNYVNNATLTIEAGTTIQMNSDASLIIDENGGLFADGTSETITFTGYVASNGYWRYIAFENDAINANCELTNCILEYGGGYSTTSGIIVIQNVATVTGNTISHSSSYGIAYDMSSGAHGDYLSDNTFSDNTKGDVYGY